MTSTNTLPCTSECPKYPGLICHLVGGHDGQHYAMGASWGRHIDQGEQGINLPPVISDATLNEIGRVARRHAHHPDCPTGQMCWCPAGLMVPGYADSPDGLADAADQARMDRLYAESEVRLAPKPEPACPSGNADLAPHRECPGCGRQQYLALSGWWTHCLADADTGCPPAWRA